MAFFFASVFDCRAGRSRVNRLVVPIKATRRIQNPEDALQYR